MLYGRLATSLSRRPGAAASCSPTASITRSSKLFLFRSASSRSIVTFGKIEQLLAGQLEQVGVDLDGDDRGGPLGHHRGERPGAGADFQHHVVRPQLGRSRRSARTRLRSMRKFCPCRVAGAMPISRKRSIRNDLVWRGMNA